MSESKWLRFVKYPPLQGRKTPIWNVYSKEGDNLLGIVRWYGRWRCFSYYPCHDTLYEKQCLRAIADFCEVETKEYLRARRGLIGA